MEINGLTNAALAYSAYNSTKTAVTKKADTQTTTTETTENTGVVYEPSTDRASIVEGLKAQNQALADNLKSMVQKLITEQAGQAGTLAELFRNANVTEEERAAAAESISEDGYWGVNQTSQRIFDFAYALSGGDEEKMQDMLEAFKEGFSQATKAWGEDLPDISSKTYDAVMEKFDNFFNNSEK